MSRQEELSTWAQTVSNRMPHLSRPQAMVLAMWSYGIALTRSCGRRTVALFLALLLWQKVNTVEQRLREWCYDAKDKRGNKRRELDVTTCFAPLLRWVVSLWAGTSIALALDATTMGDRFTVLAISVVYRGCGIPVAWTVLAAGQKEAWRSHWLRMLRQLRPAIPPEWTVLVLTDRGLYAKWLFNRIVRLGWHPFMRINQGAKFCPTGQTRWYWLNELVGEIGAHWNGSGTAFHTPSRQLACTLVAWWGAEHEEPWFILTDLPAETCEACWYALRSWCEQGFRCFKRGGWQWQNTRITDPVRAARMWLAMAVATLWMVSVGTDLELGPNADLPDIPDLRAILGIDLKRALPRRNRLFRLGWLWMLVQAIAGRPMPLPRRLVPEPWPQMPKQRPDCPSRIRQSVHAPIQETYP